MPSENVLSSEQVGVQPILARQAVAHRRQLLLAATLLFLVLSFGTLLRFINLERRVYWHDEVYTSLRSSGHRASEAVDELFLGEEFSADALLNYQSPERDRGLRNIIESLIAEEPQQPPLYSILSYVWMRAVGSSPVAMRTLAAIISLMAFPCMYWLSLELFRSRMAGWLAVALLSVSPVHVLYAREARHYSLWTLLIVLSSSALLWSLRRQTVFAWGIYALTVILGLYSHLFFVLVIVAHALYVLATTFTWPADRVSLPRPFRRYLYASFFSLLAFVPWLWIVLTSIPLILNLASWVEVSPPLSHLIRRWVVIYSVAFVDLEHLDSSGQFVPLLFVWLLIGYSLYFLFRHTTKRTWLFIYILTGTMAGALVLPDLILGGVRSTIPRYLIPSYIGLQLAVVHALSVKLGSTQSWQRAVWAVSVIGLLGIGSFSSTVAVQSEAWWDKGTDYGYPEMVRSINEASRPLLFVDSYNGGYFGDTLALGHALEPHVRLKWGIESIGNLDDIADQYSDVFWYKPTPALRKLAVRTGSYQLQPVVPDLLWRLTE